MHWACICKALLMVIQRLKMSLFFNLCQQSDSTLFIFIPLTPLSLSSSHQSFKPFHSTFTTNVLITLSHNTLESRILHYRLSHSPDLFPLSLAQLAPLLSPNSFSTLTSSYSLHSTSSSQIHPPPSITLSISHTPPLSNM